MIRLSLWALGSFAWAVSSALAASYSPQAPSGAESPSLEERQESAQAWVGIWQQASPGQWPILPPGQAQTETLLRLQAQPKAQQPAPGKPLQRKVRSEVTLEVRGNIDWCEEVRERVAPQILQLSIQRTAALRTTARPQLETITTTGFLWNGEPGIVVTSGPLLEDARRVVVRFPEESRIKPRRAEILGIDPDTGVGVLGIGSVKLDHPPVDLHADSFDEKDLGKLVLTFYSQQSEPQQGHLCNIISTDVMSTQLRGPHVDQMFEVCVIDPARPGGLVAQPDGKILGILLNRQTDDRVMRQAANSALATPIPEIRSAVDRVMGQEREPALAEEPRAWMGIGGVDLEDSLLMAHLGLAGGVFIYDVFDGGPAHRAGLERYDVVVSWNEVPVLNRLHLQEFVENSKPDSTIVLGVIHRGEQKEVPLTLEVW